MTDVFPTQIVAFSYHYWRIDSDLDALPAKEVRKQIQAAITHLYEWLGQPPAFVVEPLRLTGSLLDKTEWFRTLEPLLASTTDPRKAGYADCHSIGGTVTLTVATILNAPKTGEDIRTITPGHWTNSQPKVPYLGSQALWGANFEAELVPEAGALDPFASVAFGIQGQSGWDKWLNPNAHDQVFISSTPQAPADVVLAISGTGRRAQPATLQLARDLLPAFARFKARASDVFLNYVEHDLSPLMKMGSKLLAEFRVPERDLEGLDNQISDLAMKLAVYRDDCTAFHGHRQSVRIDRENVSTFLYRHDLPRSGWFAEVDRQLDRMDRQLDADAAYADIQFERAQTFMTALNTRANIHRARTEREENTLLSRQTVRLTGIGLVIGLGQIIDRDTGKEFVAWLSALLGTAIKDGGQSLFLARIGLVLALSAGAFIAGYAILQLFRALRASFHQ